MRGFFKWAFGYALAGLAGGVLYREVTKFAAYDGVTTLSLMHGHLLGLGMLAFLVIALLEDKVGLRQSRFFRPFMYCYNMGLMLTVVMLGVRGWWQTEGLSDNPALSGIAGAGHMLLAAGIILLFAVLFNRTKKPVHSD